MKSILGLRMLGKVVLGMRRNDLLGLAGQLAYFFLLFFFPFLIFLVSLTGLVIGNPEAGLKNLFEVFTRLVPANAQTLVVDYVDRTLRTASTGTLVLGILGALWLGQAVSISITKAANRSYRLEESRPFWRLRSTCLLITLGFTLLIAVLTLALFNVGSYLSSIVGLPESTTSLGKLLSWAMVFVAITLALDVLYYLAPDAKVPFKWITPGGFMATILLFLADGALSYYVSKLGNYGQVYGQLGGGDSLHALALRDGSDGAIGTGDKRSSRPRGGGEKGHRTGPDRVVRWSGRGLGCLGFARVLPLYAVLRRWPKLCSQKFARIGAWKLEPKLSFA